MTRVDLLADYTRVEVLAQGKVSTSRWRHLAEKRTVIVKVAAAAADGAEHARLVYEYSILQILAERCDATVVKPLALLQRSGETALVLEDIGGKDVLTLARQGELTLHDVVNVGQQVARALGQVHQARIIHKDVTPQNIVYNRRTAAAQLVDFDIATRLGREWQHGDNLKLLEGTLPYISPEQTGRVNRAIDYRTDFYSLGATLYELIAHRAPFAGTRDDLLEMVHAIISRQPPPLEDVAPHTPVMLARIVRKMMAKSVEDRYQSAHGIVEDLGRCLATGSTHELFPLAQFDRSERFEPPQKLYGREPQRRALLGEFALAAVGGRRLVLVSGPSGVGKSSLVHELQPAIVASKGRFVGGKFDQMRRHVPLDAFNDAISRFVRQVLAEDASVVERWKAVILQHVGGLGEALVNLVPILEALLGPQRALPTLPPQETAARLLTALCGLVRALGQERPLVLFLDDLQWADTTTFQLLDILLSDTQACAGLLIIGAQRDADDAQTDVATVEPLLRLAGKFKAAQLQLGPLSRSDVGELLADTLHSANADIADLAAEVHGKTGGNAFFVGEFLKHLWSQEIITYEVQEGRWRWNIQAVHMLQATDNVAAFMERQLRNTSANTQAVLGLAACMGDEFSLASLARMSDHDEAAVAAALWPVVEAGFLIPLDVGHRYAGTAAARFKFAHDRVRLACFDLLEQEPAKRHHHRIAQELLRQISDPAGEALFAVLHHFACSHELLVDRHERAAVGRLHVKAAKEAKRAAAYGAAQRHLHHAAELLQGAPTPQPLLDVELELADCEYLAGQYDRANVRLAQLLAQTQDPVERARYQSRRVHVLYGSGKPAAAVDAAVEGLAWLGVKIAAKPSLLTLGGLLITLRRRLRALPSVAVIKTLPEMQDPRATVITELFGSLFHSAQVLGNDELFALVSWHLLLLTLDFGLSQATAFACATSALTLMAALGDAKLGKGLSAVSTDLINSRGTVWIASARLAISTVESHLTYSPEQLAEYDLESCQMGVAAGDFAGIALSTVFGAAIHMGLSLSRYDDFYAARRPLAKNSPEALLCMDIVQQAVRCLRGDTEGPASFTSAERQETELRQGLTPVAAATFNSMKLQCAVIQRDFTTTLESISLQSRDTLFRQHAYVSLGAIRGFFFGVGLTQEALQAGRKQVRMPRLLRWAQRRLAWFVKHGGAPVYGGCALLVQAQAAAVQGRVGEAVLLYEKALPQLDASGYRYYAAIGYECAGRFCMDRQLNTAGRAYLLRAHALYEGWGALRKVMALEEEFSALLRMPVAVEMAPTLRARAHPRMRTHTTHYNSAKPGAPTLDWVALLNAAQAISREVQLDKVVSCLLDVLLSSAGADYGALYMPSADGMRHQAHRGNVPTLGAEASERVLAYVERTRTLLILNAGDNDALWADPYLTARHPKSVLCAPIVHKNQLVGLVYLENANLTQAFTVERIGVVNVVAGQAAVSLENALLYTELEKRVDERTLELRAAQAQLLRLEKGNTEVQMAGGFAHEMRNALFAAGTLLGRAVEPDEDTGENLYDATGTALAHCLRLALDSMPTGQLEEFKRAVSAIVTYQDELNELIVDAKESTDRALRITRQILDYAKLGRVAAQQATSKPAEVIERSLREMATALAAQDVQVHREFIVQGVVQVPEDHLHSIISNLMVNAKDALKGLSGRQPTLSVMLTLREDRVCIDVVDNGPGIPEHVKDRLFQPFVSTKGAAGTGLGLAMTRKLVELYGGTIEVTSAADQGTRFRVALPASPVT